MFGGTLVSNKQVPKLPSGDAQIAPKGFFDGPDLLTIICAYGIMNV